MFPLFNNQLVNTQCLQNTGQLSVHEMHRAARTTIGFTFLSYLFTTNLRLKRAEWSFHQRTEHGTEWTLDRGRRTRPSWAGGRISRRPRATGEREIRGSGPTSGERVSIEQHKTDLVVDD